MKLTMPGRFVNGLCLLGLLLAGSGCNRQMFVPREEYDTFLPRKMETEPVPPQPLLDIPKAPATVLDPDRPARELTLQQAIAISLDNGTVSANGGLATGLSNDTMVVFTGSSLALQSDRLNVLKQVPALAMANIEQALARWDPQFINAMVFTGTGEAPQSTGGFNNGQSFQNQTSIMKAFSSGAIVSATSEVDYRFLTAAFSPEIPGGYSYRMAFAMEQPLWRDFGTEINQLLNRVAPFYGTLFPTYAQTAYGNKLNVLNQGSSLAGGGQVFTEGILIARIRADSQRADFERNVNNMVLNVEASYWKLYQAYGTLYAYEELMRIVHKGWMVYKSKFDAGAKDGSLKEYAPILAKYHELRYDRYQALGAVLDAERNLRGIMGIPNEDGTRLVPITSPTLSYYQPNYCAAIKDALSLRPELFLARENVRLSQLNLINQKNFLKPDLRLLAQYQPVGFGPSLLGNGTTTGPFGTVPTGAFNSVGQYNDWTVGMVLNIPLGFRLEQAAVRQARLGLLQSFELLKDQEQRATRQLDQQYQKLSEWYCRLEAVTEQRKAYTLGLQAYFAEIEKGKEPVSQPIIVLLGQLQPAMLQQFEAIAQYNTTLAWYAYTKGALLSYDNINITEGPVPDCVQIQALERLRQATHALPIRSRPDTHVDPVATPSWAVAGNNDLPETLTPTAYDKKLYSNISMDALTRKDIINPLTGQPLSTQATPGPMQNQAPTQSQAGMPDVLAPTSSSANPTTGSSATGASQQIGGLPSQQLPSQLSGAQATSANWPSGAGLPK